MYAPLLRPRVTDNAVVESVLCLAERAAPHCPDTPSVLSVLPHPLSAGPLTDQPAVVADLALGRPSPQAVNERAHSGGSLEPPRTGAPGTNATHTIRT